MNARHATDFAEPRTAEPEPFELAEPSAREIAHARAICAAIDAAPKDEYIAATLAAKLSEFIDRVGFPQSDVEPLIRKLDAFCDAIEYEGLAPELTEEMTHG